MGSYIGQKTIKEMIHAGHHVAKATVTVLGLTFKEDCPDLRNSRVIDVIHELQSFGVDVQVADPEADAEEAKHEYGINLVPLDQLAPAAAVVVAVAHKEFRELTTEQYLRMLQHDPVVIDVKGVCDRDALTGAGVRLWRL
jgi:UDP-N-acetyl-D-galactosamine dehydrogenase